MKRLTAGLVIPTYYRAQILDRALAHWVGSHRRPDQVVVVDASPDAKVHRETVLEKFPSLFQTRDSQYLVVGEPSSTAQRNRGIDVLWTDIVLLPDDDQIPSADYLERIMEVFEADSEQKIGGVKGVLPQHSPNPKSSLREKMKARYLAWEMGVSGKFLNESDLWPQAVCIPETVAHLPVRRVPILWQTGTNFRTHLIRTARFDENMRRYALNEDAEVSLRIGQTCSLAERSDAYIDHCPTTDGRIGGLQVFLLCWLNSAYLVRKNYPKSRRLIRRSLRRAEWFSKVHEYFPFLWNREFFRRHSYPIVSAMVECLLTRDPYVEIYQDFQNYILDTRNYLKDYEPFEHWLRQRPWYQKAY